MPVSTAEPVVTFVAAPVSTVGDDAASATAGTSAPNTSAPTMNSLNRLIASLQL